MPDSDHVIIVSIVELSSTDQAVLNVVSHLLEKERFKVRFLEKGDTSGMLVLVDIDTSIGHDFYQQVKAIHGQTLLLLSTEIINEHRYSVLRKPIRVQTLKDALLDSYSLLTPQTVSQDTADNVQQTVPPILDPKTSLFFILLNAKQEKQIIQIFCYPHTSLFINSTEGIVATSASRETLRKVLSSLNSHMKITKLSTADFEVLAKGQFILPLPHILWMAALYSSHGHLIPGHSEETLIQLKSWPNLSRLECKMEHIKLASIMTSQPLTLKQIAEKTQLSWTTVVGFYNATYTMGLIVINPHHLPTTAMTQQTAIHQDGAKSSLFAKIIRRLKLTS